MIPRFKPYFTFDEIKAIIGEKENIIYNFEKKFANIVNAKYAVSFPSGRSGLYSLLKSLNISNKEIIIPAYTCLVVPTAVIASGNKLRFVDISLQDYNMELPVVPYILSKETAAIIPTHMYGTPMDVKTLREIVDKNVYIIEDAAQAVLTKNVGKYSDAVFYSFNIEKQVFTFGGGMVTTNNEEIYEKLKTFKNHNFKPPSKTIELKKTFLLLNTPFIFSDSFFRFILTLWESHGLLTWKKRGWNLNNKNLPVEEIYLSNDFIENYTRVQAAVGLSQLKKIKNNIKHRVEISKFYNEQLKDYVKKTITLPVLKNGSTFSHYTIRVEDRKDFEMFMKKHGIQINKVFDYSIPHIPVFNKHTRDKEEYPHAYIAGKNNINLPTYPQLWHNKNKLQHIIECVKEYDKSQL